MYEQTLEDMGFITGTIAELREAMGKRKNPVALDIETYGTNALDPLQSQVRLFQFAWGDPQNPKIFIHDTKHPDGFDPKEIGSAACLFLIHNARFEQGFLLHHYNVEIPALFDTMRASRLIYNGLEKRHDLATTLVREIGTGAEKGNEGASDWGQELTKDQLHYAATDVRWLGAAYLSLRKKLIDMELTQVAKIEFDVVLAEADIQNRGFYLNKDVWDAIGVINRRKHEECITVLHNNMPNPYGQISMVPTWNPASSVELVKSLRQMGVPVDDVNALNLAQIKDDYPIIEKVQLYKKYATRVKMFGEDYFEYEHKLLKKVLPTIHPVTGRVHCSFFAFTGAGRYATSKPNLQQIPRSDPNLPDEDYRKCFQADTGNVLVSADYSGIEMRIAAQLTGCPVLSGAIRAGLDIHRNTASLISGVPYDEVTSQQRQDAKGGNFGILYGMGAKKIKLTAKKDYNVDLTVKEALAMKQKYLDNYTGIKAWHKRILSDSGKACGYTRTLSNRIRYLDPETQHCAFANTPIQGTGADGLKMSLRKVYDSLKNIDGVKGIVHHVHDEITVECVDDPEVYNRVKEQLTSDMIECMARLVPDVPLEADAAVGKTWADVH